MVVHDPVTVQVQLRKDIVPYLLRTRTLHHVCSSIVGHLSFPHLDLSPLDVSVLKNVKLLEYFPDIHDLILISHETQEQAANRFLELGGLRKSLDPLERFLDFVKIDFLIVGRVFLYPLVVQQLLG